MFLVAPSNTIIETSGCFEPRRSVSSEEVNGQSERKGLRAGQSEIFTEPCTLFISFLHDSCGRGYSKSFVLGQPLLACRMLYVNADEVAQSGHAEEDIGQSPCPRGPDFLVRQEDVSCKFCFSSDSTISTFPNFCAE